MERPGLEDERKKFWLNMDDRGMEYTDCCQLLEVVEGSILLGIVLSDLVPRVTNNMSEL